jgi:hypothetical protein
MPGGSGKISQCNAREVKAFLLAGTVISIVISAVAILKHRNDFFGWAAILFCSIWVISLWIQCLKRLAQLKREKS